MLRRVIAEHRLIVAVLAAGLIANVGLYAGLIRPLAMRVSDADNRAAFAARARNDAQREFDAAAGIARSRERAETELAAFYRDVLPANLDAAHKLVYLDLAVRARQNRLRIVHRTASPGHDKGSGFGRLEVNLVLGGQYEDMRRFLNGIERGPGFIVIDGVAMDPGQGQDSLVLTMQLSTFYRVAADAS